jgi:hypothetical protein
MPASSSWLAFFIGECRCCHALLFVCREANLNAFQSAL